VALADHLPKLMNEAHGRHVHLLGSFVVAPNVPDALHRASAPYPFRTALCAVGDDMHVKTQLYGNGPAPLVPRILGAWCSGELLVSRRPLRPVYVPLERKAKS
jgi:hypothetical protein